MRRLLCLAALLCLTGCAASRPAEFVHPNAMMPTAARPLKNAPPRLVAKGGVASYMAERYNGQRTASGSIYDDGKLVAAHATLPFGTHVRVTNVTNGRSVIVTIVDRGPYRKGRVIDVSRRAARDLGFLSDGVAPVQLELVAGGE